MIGTGGSGEVGEEEGVVESSEDSDGESLVVRRDGSRFFFGSREVKRGSGLVIASDLGISSESSPTGWVSGEVDVFERLGSVVGMEGSIFFIGFGEIGGGLDFVATSGVGILSESSPIVEDSGVVGPLEGDACSEEGLGTGEVGFVEAGRVGGEGTVMIGGSGELGEEIGDLGEEGSIVGTVGNGASFLEGLGETGGGFDLEKIGEEGGLEEIGDLGGEGSVVGRVGNGASFRAGLGDTGGGFGLGTTVASDVGVSEGSDVEASVGECDLLRDVGDFGDGGVGIGDKGIAGTSFLAGLGDNGGGFGLDTTVGSDVISNGLNLEGSGGEGDLLEGDTRDLGAGGGEGGAGMGENGKVGEDEGLEERGEGGGEVLVWVGVGIETGVSFFAGLGETGGGFGLDTTVPSDVEISNGLNLEGSGGEEDLLDGDFGAGGREGGMGTGDKGEVGEEEELEEIGEGGGEVFVGVRVGIGAVISFLAGLGETGGGFGLGTTVSDVEISNGLNFEGSGGEGDLLEEVTRDFWAGGGAGGAGMGDEGEGGEDEGLEEIGEGGGEVLVWVRVGIEAVISFLAGLGETGGGFCLDTTVPSDM